MADIYNMVGSTFWTAAASISIPDDGEMDATDFAAVTWIQVKGWQTAGRIGDAAQVTTITMLDSGRDRKLKGTKNAGTMENTFAPIPADPGQVAMLAHEASCDNFPFCVIYAVTCPGGALVTPETAVAGQMRQFAGLVVSSETPGGDGNTARMLTSSIEINSNIVVV